MAKHALDVYTGRRRQCVLLKEDFMLFLKVSNSAFVDFHKITQVLRLGIEPTLM